MRKALLVIAMVAASFLGGAVVNGPGLAWLAGALGLEPIKVGPLGPDALDREPEVVAVADEAANGPEESSSPQPEPQPAPETIATESVHEENEPPVVAKADPMQQPEPASDPEPPQPLNLGSQPPPLEPPAVGLQTETETETEPEPEPETKQAESKPDSPLEPGWGDAPGSAPALAFLPGAKEAQPSSDPDVMPATMPPDDPDPPPAEAESPAPEELEKTENDGDSADGWAKLHDRMSAMGVSRYWVEGDPSGVVRFRCVVPLAAGGAVAQQFEAEGDDLQSAVEATLRRIDLWRATEAEPKP